MEKEGEKLRTFWKILFSIFSFSFLFFPLFFFLLLQALRHFFNLLQFTKGKQALPLTSLRLKSVLCSVLVAKLGTHWMGEVREAGNSLCKIYSNQAFLVLLCPDPLFWSSNKTTETAQLEGFPGSFFFFSFPFFLFFFSSFLASSKTQGNQWCAQTSDMVKDFQDLPHRKEKWGCISILFIIYLELSPVCKFPALNHWINLWHIF